MQMWHFIFELTRGGGGLTSGKGQEGPWLGQISRPPSTDTFKLRIRQGVTRAAEVLSFSATHCVKLVVSQANWTQTDHRSDFAAFTFFRSFYWLFPDHVDKGRDENEDDAKYSDQGAVGARLDDLLWNRLHGSRKELQKRSREQWAVNSPGFNHVAPACVYLDAGIYGTNEEDVSEDDEDTDVDSQHDRGAAGNTRIRSN